MKRFFTVTCSVLLMFGISILVAQAELVGHWTFEPGSELVDLSGNFEDLVLHDATIDGGQLDVGVDQWAYAGGYSGPDITEKTLMSWLSLDDLEVQAGSALTIDKISEDEFDGIIFGERQPHRWMNGSSFWRRTVDADPGFEETETGELINITITYADEGGSTHLTLYRNGEKIGEYTQGDIPTWTAGDTEVFFGNRHGNAEDGGPGNLDALIEESRIYNEALSQNDIQTVTAVNPGGKISTLWGMIKDK